MSRFKQALKELVPPILTTVIGGRYTKRCATWEAARSKGTTYESNLLNKFRVDRHQLRKADSTLLDASILRMMVGIIQREDLRLTDFGGATGDLGMEFARAFPDASVTVVENATLVSMMEKQTTINFAKEMPNECDIFYSSGTLQYIDSPMQVLRAGFQSAKCGVVLVRNSFSESEAFHIQTSRLFDNGVGPIPVGYRNERISYPHRSIRESEVLALARELGFELIARLEEVSGQRGDTYGKQLVFLRRASAAKISSNVYLAHARAAG